MPRQSDLRFTFEPACGAAFEVIEFTLEEGLSQPFKLELELASHDPALDFGTLLDKPAVLTIWHAETPVRYVHGLVSRLTQGDTGFRRTRYHAVVEPTLARARLRSDWRIFQQQSVPEILNAVLKAQRLTDYEQVICFDHAPREYCVQAGETDLDFLARLAAEEGLLYTFEHRADGHRLIHTDRVQGLGSLPPNLAGSTTVRYHAAGGGDSAEPALQRFRYTEHVRTSRQVQRDYTFTHPRYAQEHAADGTQLDHQNRSYERYDYPGRYKRDAVGKPFTKTRLSALRNDARIAEVEGDDPRLQPGLAFDLSDHPRDDMNVRWRTVSIVHTGTQHSSQQEEAAGSAAGTRYHLKATLIPDSADWKAPLLPKPRLDGPQTATVVGPPGEEIFCDKWGRIKVSFPWDRTSQNNQHSSCWIRVAQGWAGTTWGAMAIPRIGQEVIVDHLDGDPDQPIVMGRAYREANLPPYELPKHKTRMTIKSQTHKGDGSNELRFEDEKAQEEIYIHAQKDQNNHVNNNETTFVGNDRSERVEHNETLSIGDHRTEDVGKNETIQIGANRSVTIGANKAETIALAKAETIGLGKALTIGGGYQTSVGAAMNTTVGLSQSEQVGIHKSVLVGKRFTIEAGDEFVVQVGKSQLVMKSDGTVLINGCTFDFSASGAVQINGKNVDIN
ncbi:type VI secretion system Vgr family protein [Pseudomonas fluorescens]|uniref:Actin cross-linking toxin VgrG1 n=1 Tax=Pseudomonas fluorescens TaxID=294 RepID=A0A5E7BS84_PSEFL|nr:type VI secretion system tip protein TssI/VgrG [Pseudomonas fluorescens]VVN92547.1 Actin cross-linking toxin VgrG1 [Pseudomonas fluorescens]